MAQSNNTHLRGINIYLDDKGRDVYYDRLFTKCGYLIQEKNKGTYSLYANRFFIPIMVAVVTTNIIFTEQQSILMAIGIYILLEALFRFKFLPSLTKLKKFKPTNKLRLIEQIQTQDRNKTLILAFLLMALAILIVLYAITEGYQGLYLLMCCLIGVGAAFFSIVYFAAVLKKKK